MEQSDMLSYIIEQLDMEEHPVIQARTGNSLSCCFCPHTVQVLYLITVGVEDLQ